MINVQKCSADKLVQLKKQYIDQATAPLDGMWLCGFVPLSAHFGFYSEDELVGYCCLNDEGYLLQFYVTPEHDQHSVDIFNRLNGKNQTITGDVNGAFVSTAEPGYLSNCLDYFSSFEVNGLMYEHQNGNQNEADFQSKITLKALGKSQLGQVVDFAHGAMGAPTDWLTGYYSNLIDRQELFGYWRSENLAATGEIRNNAVYQNEYVDIGMIVAESERGKGIATEVLKTLAHMAQSKGLAPICSTEPSNIGAQKAIHRAGFIAKNRILQFNSN